MVCINLTNLSTKSAIRWAILTICPNVTIIIDSCMILWTKVLLKPTCEYKSFDEFLVCLVAVARPMSLPSRIAQSHFSCVLLQWPGPCRCHLVSPNHTLSPFGRCRQMAAVLATPSTWGATGPEGNTFQRRPQIRLSRPTSRAERSTLFARWRWERGREATTVRARRPVRSRIRIRPMGGCSIRSFRRRRFNWRLPRHG